jgi:hypothetical protein
MPTVFAQGIVEYVGVSGQSATSALDVLGEQLNTVYYAVFNSASEYPFLWAAGACVAAYVLFFRRK